MKKYISSIILLTTLFFITSCKTPKGAMNEGCKMFQDSIRSNWTYDTVQNHYNYPNELFFEKIAWDKSNSIRDCILSHDTSYIVNLLGKHYRLEKQTSIKNVPENKLIFMLTKYPCLGRGRDFKCKGVIFYYNNSGMIKYIDYQDIQESIEN